MWHLDMRCDFTRHHRIRSSCYHINPNNHNNIGEGWQLLKTYSSFHRIDIKCYQIDTRISVRDIKSWLSMEFQPTRPRIHLTFWQCLPLLPTIHIITMNWMNNFFCKIWRRLTWHDDVNFSLLFTKARHYLITLWQSQFIYCSLWLPRISTIWYTVYIFYYYYCVHSFSIVHTMYFCVLGLNALAVWCL